MTMNCNVYDVSQYNRLLDLSLAAPIERVGRATLYQWRYLRNRGIGTAVIGSYGVYLMAYSAAEGRAEFGKKLDIVAMDDLQRVLSCISADRRIWVYPWLPHVLNSMPMFEAFCYFGGIPDPPRDINLIQPGELVHIRFFGAGELGAPPSLQGAGAFPDILPEPLRYNSIPVGLPIYQFGWCLLAHQQGLDYLPLLRLDLVWLYQNFREFIVEYRGMYPMAAREHFMGALWADGTLSPAQLREMATSLEVNMGT